MSQQIDWSTTEGCERCNEHGPYLEWEYEAFKGEWMREAHKAQHEVREIALAPVVRIMQWLDRRYRKSATRRLVRDLNRPV